MIETGNGLTVELVRVKGTSKNNQFSAISEWNPGRSHLFAICLMSGLAGL
jgi:hypothetical protein